MSEDRALRELRHMDDEELLGTAEAFLSALLSISVANDSSYSGKQLVENTFAALEGRPPRNVEGSAL